MEFPKSENDHARKTLNRIVAIIELNMKLAYGAENSLYDQLAKIFFGSEQYPFQEPGNFLPIGAPE